MTRKKANPKPPRKPYLFCYGVFSRKDGKLLSWADVDALLAAAEKAGFVYGGGLVMQTEAEAEKDSMALRPQARVIGDGGRPVEVKVTGWTYRTG